MKEKNEDRKENKEAEAWAAVDPSEELANS